MIYWFLDEFDRSSISGPKFYCLFTFLKNHSVNFLSCWTAACACSFTFLFSSLKRLFSLSKVWIFRVRSTTCFVWSGILLQIKLFIIFICLVRNIGYLNFLDPFYALSITLHRLVLLENIYLRLWNGVENCITFLQNLSYLIQKSSLSAPRTGMVYKWRP